MNMFNFDNLLKGPFTSGLGFAGMCFAGYGWWVDHLTDMQAGVLAMVGFALLFMRDQIPGFIQKFIDKKTGGNVPLWILLSLISLSAFGQQTDASLKTQSDVIRNETTPRANTATRIANMYQSLIDSKVNRAEMLVVSGTDTYTLTANSTITSYVTGVQFLVKFTNANTGAATLNVNSLGAIPIKKAVTSALSSGDIAAGQVLWLTYDGTNFQITGGLGGSSAVWGAITGTLSSQTDLNSALSGKQATLVSGSNIKTINGATILGSSDIALVSQTLTRNRQTGDYTLALSDNFKLIEINSASNQTVTVPANGTVAFTADQTSITIIRYGTGAVSIAAAGGVTIHSAGAATGLRAQYSSAQLIKIGTDEWYLIGDLQ